MLTKDRLVQYSAASFWRGEMAGEVISLYDMCFEFAVLEIATSYEILGRMMDRLNTYDKGRVLTERDRAGLFQLLSRAKHGLLRLNKENLLALHNVIEMNLRSDCQVGLISTGVVKLHSWLENEMYSLPIHLIPPSSLKHLKPEAIPDTIRDRFPECVRDLEQANKCFAFGLEAACVYHCGCLLQPILEYLATSVQVLGGTYDPKSTTWSQLGTICTKLEADVARLNDTTKTDAVREELKSLGDLARHVRVLLYSWRNDNAHGRNTYAPGEVEKILHGTTNLVEYLAQKKSEKE